MADLDRALALLDDYVHLKMHTVPGLALALTGREGLLHTAFYGLADVAARIPVTTDTLFEIGSVTKSFTAIALLQLCEAGVVDLHAPVTRYLPWFEVQSRYEPITLHHLLSHTAGIVTGTDFSTQASFEVWALRQTEVAAPPGTFFHYSNVGYKALGLVLEELLGQSYGQIVEERILEPLGMAATQAAITHETRLRLATGYEPWYDDRPARPADPLAPATWLETGTADGSIAASVTDMATYLAMLMNHGQGPRSRILSEESFRLMTQRLIQPSEEDEDHGTFYGYGLNVADDGGHTIIGHDGGMVGYYSAILADMDDGLGVVVLTNGPGEPGEIARFVLKVLQAATQHEGLPPLPAVPDPACVESPHQAADYAGSYRSQARDFDLVAEGQRLVLSLNGEQVILERRGDDRFLVPHPDMARFLLRFGRQGDRVVEAWHGPDWYVNEHYPGGDSPAADPPATWRAYAGHYRSHNPWYTNFRIVLRRGALFFVRPWGEEQILVPLEEGFFRIGEDERSPERLRFDTIVGGQAIRANLSGCDYYRTFTP